MKTQLEHLQLPRNFDYFAKSEFERIKPLLAECGFLEIDRPLLCAYLQAYSNWSRAKNEIVKNGLTILTPTKQLQINPNHTILKQNAELLKSLASELGLSPASRKKHGLVIKPQSDMSAALFGSGQLSPLEMSKALLGEAANEAEKGNTA